MTHPAVRRLTGTGSPWALVTAAVLVAALVVAGALVVVRGGERRPAGRPIGVEVDVAANFVRAVMTTDREARLAAISRYVIPNRVPEFVTAFDAVLRSTRPDRGRTSPAAFRVAEQGQDVAVVLLWCEVAGPGSDAVTGEVTGVGVTYHEGRWWVFSYQGTLPDVPRSDRRLEGFKPLIGG